MKRIKRIASLILAMAMIFAMSATVLAASGGGAGQTPVPQTGGDEPDPKGEDIPQSNKSVQSAEYKIYQVFTGTYDAEKGGILSAVKWGKNSTGDEGKLVDQSVLDALNINPKDDTADNNYRENDTAQLEVIKRYADLSGDPYKTVTLNEGETSDGSVTCTEMEPGYYLITGNVVFSDDLGNSDTVYVVRVTGTTLTFKPKVDVPTVDKKIVETVKDPESGEDTEKTNELDANAVPIGGTVNYKITGTLPTNYADYKKYTYEFTDTLSKGLTYGIATDKKDQDGNTVYEGNLKVMAGTTDITSILTPADADADAGAIVFTENEKDGTTTITVKINDLKALSKKHNITLDSSSTIVVTYTATVNKDAAAELDGSSNKVKLTYSNDPNWAPDPNKPDDENNPPTGKTPEKVTKTYTTSLEIIKKGDNAEGQLLSGAGFTLESKDGVKAVLVTGTHYVEATDGTYYKLKNGSYTQTAPDENNKESYVAPAEGEDYQKYKLEPYTEAQTTPIETNGSIELVTGTDGTVKFTGLGAGIYTLTETITPEGYNPIAPIKFKVELVEVKDTDGNITGYSFKVLNEDGSGPLVKDPSVEEEKREPIFTYADGKLSATIINKKGSLLPSTGGIGTTIFYVVGGVLVAGAGVLLVTRKRMSARSGR